MDFNLDAGVVGEEAEKLPDKVVFQDRTAEGEGQNVPEGAYPAVGGAFEGGVQDQLGTG